MVTALSEVYFLNFFFVVEVSGKSLLGVNLLRQPSSVDLTPNLQLKKKQILTV